MNVTAQDAQISSFVEPVSFGNNKFIVVGLASVDVKIKKVISINPRSTMGVRSTRVDLFAHWVRRLLLCEHLGVISAIIVSFS